MISQDSVLISVLSVEGKTNEIKHENKVNLCAGGKSRKEMKGMTQATSDWGARSEKLVKVFTWINSNTLNHFVIMEMGSDLQKWGMKH